MANYDSVLTSAQIESALTTINGLIASSNNGKVLTVASGQLAAKSVIELRGGTLDSLSVTENGTYTHSGIGGYSSIDVEVSLTGTAALAAIVVTKDEGAVCTATQGTIEYESPSTGTQYIFCLPVSGTWTVASDSNTETVTLSDYEVAYLNVETYPIYGIYRDLTSSSTAWTRSDASASYSATASFGSTAGSSDFTGKSIYEDIERVTLSTGDVMVKIPKFYFKRYQDNDIEYIKICATQKTGFTLHPAFAHNGETQDYIYVGAYHNSITDSVEYSVTGATPNSATRAAHRTNATAKGTGWGLLDLSTWSAIQMLAIIEFADNNLQTLIGNGKCTNGGTLDSGSCDSVPGLTGSPSGTQNLVDVVWRGIEGIWGNGWIVLDGINVNANSNGDYYICNNQSDYTEGESSDYTKLSFNGGTGTGRYPTRLGVDTDNRAYMLPLNNYYGGSTSTYYPDLSSVYSNGWDSVNVGGGSSDYLADGLFCILAGGTGDSNHARLIYIPESA